ncbi:MAG: sulfotransferase [Acidimicrobiales bacterium]
MSSTTLPNLFLIGTHKGGTTSFYEMLATHPAIHAPEPKEPGYFSLTPTITPSNLADYEAIYRDATEQHSYRLDGSTSYAQTIRYPDTIGRIRQHCGPDVKFIYLLRDPIERMRAAYVQLRSEGNNDLPRDLTQALPRLIEPTMYLLHYEAYAAVWGPESIFVATFEELIAAPQALTSRCLDFLGVEQRSLQTIHANAGTNRIQNAPALDAIMKVPGALALASRLAASPLGVPLQRIRSHLSVAVEKPDITPEILGDAWPEIRRQAEDILAIAGRDASDWKSLAGTPQPA